MKRRTKSTEENGKICQRGYGKKETGKIHKEITEYRMEGETVKEEVTKKKKG